MTSMPVVVVRDRNLGKTTELVNWLLGGHLIGGWPGWSRVLVVANKGRVTHLYREFPEQHRALREAGCAGLGKVVVTAEEWPRLCRGIARDVEWALDDAEQIIACQFGSLPNIMSMTGEAQ